MQKTVFVLVAALAMGLVACGGGADAPGGGTADPSCVDLTAGDTFTITITDFAFDPACLTVKASQGISIVNQDSVDHTFTISGTQIDVTIPAGQTFNGEAVSGAVEPGTYGVFCRLHPSMTGTVTVG
jgi:plastocyanin